MRLKIYNIVRTRHRKNLSKAIKLIAGVSLPGVDAVENIQHFTDTASEKSQQGDQTYCRRVPTRR